MTEELVFDKTIFNELKQDRKKARDRVLNAVKKDAISAVSGGWLPSIEQLMEVIMDEISCLIDDFPHIESDAWSIIFQRKHPDRFCNRTAQFMEKKCKKNDVQDVETSSQ